MSPFRLERIQIGKTLRPRSHSSIMEAGSRQEALTLVNANVWHNGQ